MRWMRTVVTVGLVTLVACSDDDGATEDETTSTTVGVTTETPETTTTIDPAKQAFLDAANGICADMNDSLEAVAAPYGDVGPENPEVMAVVVAGTADVMVTTVERLRDLEPPPADEDDLDALFASMDGVVDLYRALGTALESGDAVEIANASNGLENANAELDALYAASGLDTCAERDG
jgi:hypothetical protein